MSATVSLFAVALFLIGLLVLLLRRSDSILSSDLVPLGSDDDPPNGYREFEERREELLNRIFGLDDWDYVSRTSKQVQRLFLKERKEIAFCWISDMRSRAKIAMRTHVAHARKADKLQPALELRLTFEYFMIRAKCELIAAILWLRGPVAMRRMIKQLTGLSIQVRGLLELASKAVPR